MFILFYFFFTFFHVNLHAISFPYQAKISVNIIPFFMGAGEIKSEIPIYKKLSHLSFFEFDHWKLYPGPTIWRGYSVGFGTGLKLYGYSYHTVYLYGSSYFKIGGINYNKKKTIFNKYARIGTNIGFEKKITKNISLSCSFHHEIITSLKINYFQNPPISLKKFILDNRKITYCRLFINLII